MFLGYEQKSVCEGLKGKPIGALAGLVGGFGCGVNDVDFVYCELIRQQPACKKHFPKLLVVKMAKLLGVMVLKDISDVALG